MEFSAIQLQLFAACLMVVAVGGLAMTLGFYCSTRFRGPAKQWLCYCGMKNAAGQGYCYVCGRMKGQK